MRGRLTKLACLTGAILLTTESAQSRGGTQYVAQATPDTTVSTILEDTDSDSATQLEDPGNPSDSLSSMRGRLTKLACLTGAILLTTESAQSRGGAQYVAQATPDTTVSTILEDTDSDSATQLEDPGNPSDSLSVSLEDALPAIQAPERRHEQVIDSRSVNQVPFEEKNRSLTIIDVQ